MEILGDFSFLPMCLFIQSLVYANVDSWVFILDLKAGGRYMAFVMWVSILVCVWSISNEVKKLGLGPSPGAEPSMWTVPMAPCGGDGRPLWAFLTLSLT